MKEPYDFNPLIKLAICILAIIGLLTLLCPKAIHALEKNYEGYSSEGSEY